MYGFINKILGVVLCFILIVLMLSAAMMSEQVQARRSIVAEVTNFVDEVTDTGVLDERHVADLYLACSAYGPITDVQILRYVKVVNPDPKEPGSTYMTYVASENIYQWNQGDILKVNVKEVGPTGLAGFLYRIFGLTMAPVDFTLAGRIR